MTHKGHAIPSKTQLLSYGTPALGRGIFKGLIMNSFHSIPEAYNG